MIGHLPLWLVIYVWLLQRRNTPRISVTNYPRMLRLLDDVYYSLPVPTSGMERYLVARVIAWIDQEKAMLRLLQSLSVIAAGIVKR